jgi:hypothetical protein
MLGKLVPFAINSLVVLVAILVSMVIVDVLGYAFLPPQYTEALPGYRSTWDNQLAIGYARGYFRRDAQLGFDIEANANATAYVDGTKYPIFSNSVGCFDKRDVADFQNNNWVYFAGDSFTWGFAPYETKFATEFERLTGIKTAKCGVPHTGTRHEFEKFKLTVQRIGFVPSLVFVAFFENDLQNDFAHPHSTVIDGWLADNAYASAPRTLGLYRPPLSLLEEAVRRELNGPLSGSRPHGPLVRLAGLLNKNSLSLNLLEYWGLKLIEIADPTARVGHSKFGYSIYYLDDPAKPARPENNKALEMQNSLLAEPTKQAMLEWQKHANEMRYRLVFVIVPRKPQVEDVGHYPDYYAQVKTFLNSHAIEHVDLTERFREEGLAARDLYWEHDAHFNQSGNLAVGRILADWCHQNKCAPSVAPGG